jgi:hypothetical protein
VDSLKAQLKNERGKRIHVARALRSPRGSVEAGLDVNKMSTNVSASGRSAIASSSSASHGGGDDVSVNHIRIHSQGNSNINSNTPNQLNSLGRAIQKCVMNLKFNHDIDDDYSPPPMEKKVQLLLQSLYNILTHALAPAPTTGTSGGSHLRFCSSGSLAALARSGLTQSATQK